MLHVEHILFRSHINACVSYEEEDTCRTHSIQIAHICVTGDTHTGIVMHVTYSKVMHDDVSLMINLCACYLLQGFSSNMMMCIIFFMHVTYRRVWHMRRRIHVLQV